MEQADVNRIVDDLSEEALQFIAMNTIWSSPTRVNNESITDDVKYTDEDGFSVAVGIDDLSHFSQIQKECWRKYNRNPQISSHVRDIKGSLTGYGWDISSENADIQRVLFDTIHDIRNELIKNIPKFVCRAEIEGELFLRFSVHKDGFVEIDFMEPSSLTGDGNKNSGIFYHPNKANMPLFYSFNVPGKNNITKKILIPSIYVAHEPSLAKFGIDHYSIDKELLKDVRTTVNEFKDLGGYKSFIVHWDKSLFTKRNVSHIYTTIEWVNHYENLKKWEIDHKKSAGSYLWVVNIEDQKAFRTWLKLTDAQKAETGIAAKKTPGGTIILPPGVTMEVKNPNLPSISEQDTDIMHMVTSGLNKPEDMVTGQTKGDTFSGIKASRGPQADRTQDQIADFERFLRLDFWRSVFLLKNKVTGFKLEYKVREAVEFKERKPVFKNVIKQAWELIDFDFPTSEVQDVEGKARAFLGVKHGNIAELLGVPNAYVAKRLGINGYKRLRLMNETEDDTYPDLPTTAELDSVEEKAGEPTADPEDNQNKGKNNS